jgi:rhamnose transport system permease protein
MGLAAVLFGIAWRDGGWPVWAAAALAVGAGGVAGALNGLLVTRLRLSPLIVTLGTFSLFRGLAEGLTGGVDTFTGFPADFLALGQGYVAGVPVQVPILVAAAVGFWLFLHRTVYGRAVVAIGFSPEGARHAGIPVELRVFTVYLLSGLAAGVAAVVYVAHLGQAKADAGTGYELTAITAVVLGGTSITGGRGSVPGTVLGLLVIAVLQNGLRLSDLPAELAGVLTGAVLLAAVGLDRLRSRPAPPQTSTDEGFSMKNSQLAVLCAVILLAAGMILAGNWLLVRSLAPARSPAANETTGQALTIAMMPKSKGNAYFIACRRGAEEAARELGVELLWDGPTDTDPAKQAEVVEAWITRGVDVIAVAVENREGLSSVLRKARARGIKVVTWDADADPDARDLFVNQATPEGIGHKLMDEAARVLDGTGEFAVITASLTAANQNEWLKHIKDRQAAKYPGMKLVAVRPCDDRQQKAFEEAATVMNAHPGVKLIMAICSPAVPGAAEAVTQAGRKDVKVIGLGLPNDNKKFVHSGVTDSVILWNTMDLGYLTVYTSVQVARGKVKAGDAAVEAGRLGRRPIAGDNVLLGQPFTFTRENIDGFDF